MDRAGQLLVNVIAHLMAGNAELFGVCQFECGIEGTPKHDTADKAADGQEAQAEVDAGSAIP